MEGVFQLLELNPLPYRYLLKNEKIVLKQLDWVIALVAAEHTSKNFRGSFYKKS